jgi:branched-chain amino acid transport system permease protein
VRGQKRGKESARAGRLPAGPGRGKLAKWTAIIIFAILAVTYVANATSYDLSVVTTIVIFAVAVVGQQWLVGGAGQVSLGGGAIMAIGAYSAGWFQEHAGLSVFPLPLVAAAVGGAVVGLIVGLPSVRLRGFYLVLATLALNFIVQFFGERYEVNHAAGLLVNPFTVLGASATNPYTTFMVSFVILALVCFLLRQLYRTAPGSILMVVRESETSAKTMGISPSAWKLSAFVGSSAVTAVAGGLYAYLLGSVSIEDFSLVLSINLVLMVYVGGVNSITGAIVGAAFAELVPIGLQHLSQDTSSAGAGAWLAANTALVQSLLFGMFLVAILLSDSTGIVGLVQSAGRWIGRRATRGGAAAGPVAPADFAEPDVLPDLIPDLIPDGMAAGEPLVTPPLAAAQRNGSVLYPSQTENSLVVSDLRVVYRTGAVGVSSVSLTVPHEKIIALVGRNAAGKTSTVRGIAGFPRDERVKVSGSVLFNGEEIRGLRPGETSRRGIAVVSEREKVFPTLSLIDNLRAIGLSARDAAAALDRVPELADLRNRAAGLLSGGQRQLLALTLAVARQPRAILVDELSLGLAPIAITSLMAQIKRIHDEAGTTIMLVDQALGVLEHTADHVYVLENGRIIADGSAEMLKAGQVSALVMGAGE